MHGGKEFEDQTRLRRARGMLTSVWRAGTEEGSVEAQIVWRNMHEEALTKDFARMNSSCSPSELSPGMLALIQNAQQRQLLSEGTLSSPDSMTCGGRTQEPEAEPSQAPAAAPPAGTAPRGKTGSFCPPMELWLALAPAVRSCGAALGNATARDAGREMWLEEEERLRKLDGGSAPVIVMGTEPMCTTGGCGYFSDDGK
jgi:hypothetical protein